MARYIEEDDRSQVALLPECLDDFIAEDNPVRVIDVFEDELDLAKLGFDGVTPAVTGFCKLWLIVGIFAASRSRASQIDRLIFFAT